MKKSNKYLLLAVFAILFGIWGYFKYFHIGEKERNFIAALQAAFQTENDVVLMKDVTNFDWDRVCLSSKWDDLSHDVGSWVTTDEQEIKAIAKNYVSWVFFKDEEIVEILGFPRIVKVQINNKEFSFFDWFKGKACNKASNAAIKPVTRKSPRYGVGFSLMFISKED